MNINDYLPKVLHHGDFMKEMSKCDNTEQKYRNTYVAYLDVLGYKNLITKLGESAPNFIFSSLCSAFASLRAAKANLRVTIFSDSIIIEGGFEHPATFWTIAEELKRLQFHLLQKKILIRGGIAFGKHFSKNNIVVSPTLIEAYMLEQNAIDPMIMISKEAFNNSHNDIFTEEGCNFIKVENVKMKVRPELIDRDSSGNSFLSLIPSHVELDFLKYGIHPDMKNIDTHREHCITQGNNVLEKIQNSLKEMRNENTAKPEVMRKINFIINQWNNYLENFANQQYVSRDYRVSPYYEKHCLSNIFKHINKFYQKLNKL
jgi:hypothetical protein